MKKLFIVLTIFLMSGKCFAAEVVKVKPSAGNGIIGQASGYDIVYYKTTKDFNGNDVVVPDRTVTYNETDLAAQISDLKAKQQSIADFKSQNGG